MEKIKIAVIGCGGIFGDHWNAYTQQFEKGFDDFEIVAFCDLIKERAQDYADRWFEAKGTKPAVFSSVEELMASGIDFSVAEVQVPHNVHHAVAIPLMKAGKHIMTEKPLGMTMRAAKLMMDCARENGVTLKVMENYRYDDSERAAAWAVKTGMIGTPRTLTMLDIGIRQWYWDWRDHKYIAGGAWTLDGGIHFADLWMNILGPVKSVMAVSGTYDTTRYKNFDKTDERQEFKYRNTRSLLKVNPETYGEPVESDLEDTTSAVLEFENGVIGTWLVSRSSTGFNDRKIVIAGSKGALEWGEGIKDYTGETVISWDELNKMYFDSLSEEEKEFLFPGGLFHTIALEQREFFDYYNGKRELEVTDETGYLDLAVPYAVYESAATGKKVYVKDVMDLKEETYQKALNESMGIE